MKDNKKKTIVVIALAAVILCVGVFQFVLGGSPPPAAPAKGPVAKKDDKKAPTDVVVPDPPKNPLFAANLPARDPFQGQALPADPKAATQPPVAPPKPQPQPRMQRLPQAEIGTGGGFAPLTVQPPAELKFAFTVSGVMLGEKPMAVFTDAKGDQRLVMLGGSLDADSKVISIDKDAVTIKFHGKTIRLTVEGNPNAK